MFSVWLAGYDIVHGIVVSATPVNPMSFIPPLGSGQLGLCCRAWAVGRGAALPTISRAVRNRFLMSGRSLMFLFSSGFRSGQNWNSVLRDR